MNQYLLIRRFNADWREIAERLSEEAESPDFGEFSLKNDEMVGASLALSRICDVYNVEPLEMALGNVSYGKPSFYL